MYKNFFLLGRIIVNQDKKMENNNEDIEKILQTPKNPTASKKPLYFMLCIVLQLIIISFLSVFLNSSSSKPRFKPYIHGEMNALVEEDGNVTMEWQKLPNKMNHLNMNPVYAKLGIPRIKFRPRVNLLLIVSSAPSRIERRMAIRETWWNQSKTNAKV